MLQGGIADVPVSLSTVVAGQEQELCWWVAGFPRWIQIPPFIFGCFKQIFSKFIALLQSSCALDTLISPVWTVIKADIGASQNSRGVGHFISIFCYIYIHICMYLYYISIQVYIIMHHTPGAAPRGPRKSGCPETTGASQRWPDLDFPRFPCVFLSQGVANRKSLVLIHPANPVLT